jgi:hypothetical protein
VPEKNYPFGVLFGEKSNYTFVAPGKIIQEIKLSAAKPGKIIEPVLLN